MTENIQVNGTETENQETRTFTQEEVNAIIQERLGKEKAKYSDYETLKQKASLYDEAEEANKTELQKATERVNALQAQVDAFTKAEEVRKVREKVSSDTNVPANLLTGSTEEECVAQAEAILQFAKPNAYPSVKDGGEVNKSQKKDAVTSFEEWFSANLQ